MGIVPCPESHVNQVWLMSPDGLDSERCLSPQLRNRADDLRWLVHVVATKARRGETDRRGYVRLSSRVLRRVMSTRTMPAVVRAAVGGGVLSIDEHRIGRRTRGYRLGPRWRGRPLRWVAVQDERLAARVAREVDRLERLRLAVMLPIHHALCESQTLLTVEPEGDFAAAAIDPEPVRHRQQTILQQIRTGYPGRRVGTGRWYSPVSRLKRSLRPYLRLAGEPLGGYDLRCAQPRLLAVLLSAQLTQFVQCVATYSSTLFALCSSRAKWASHAPQSKCPLPDCVSADSSRDGCGVLSLGHVAAVASGAPRCGRDLGLFDELTLDGGLYSHLLDRCRAAGVDLGDPDAKGRAERDVVKLLLLRDVMAKLGGYPSEFEHVFRSEFPTVHRAVRWINGRHSPDDGCGAARSHGRLVRLLQRLESALVLETVAPALLPETPIVPVHDCLFAPVSHVPRVEQAFRDVFDRCGVRFALKRDVPRAPTTYLETSA